MKKLIAELITIVQQRNDSNYTIPFHIGFNNGLILNNYFTIVDDCKCISYCQKNNDGDGIVIVMSKLAIDNLSMPTIAFLIAHEIGHARHVLKFDENFQIVPSKYRRLEKFDFIKIILASFIMSKRKAFTRRGKVLDMELEADNFAAQYFSPIEALEELKTILREPLARMEIDNRISVQLRNIEKKGSVVA